MQASRFSDTSTHAVVCSTGYIRRDCWIVKPDMLGASGITRVDIIWRGDNVALLSPGCRQEKEIEKETESESDTEIEVSTEPEGSVCRTKDVRRIIEAWNALGLQQVTKLTPGSRRGCMLRARVREYGTEAVLQAIEKIRQSAFLRGQNAPFSVGRMQKAG